MTELPARWSAEPCTERHHEAVLAWFTEPDFHFRTAEPRTRSERTILHELVDEDTRVLLADGLPMGLYALESTGSEHWSQAQLHLRLTASAPRAWWQAAYREVERAVRWQRELVRLSFWVGEHDERGLEFARTAGLTDEGTLAQVIMHDGKRSGNVFFSRIWVPTT